MKQYVLIALLVLLVACAPAQPMMEKKPVEPMQKEPVIEKAPEMVKEPIIEEKDTRMMEPGLIGGGVSRYYNWDKTMFDKAVAEGKTIYLEFSANWCPACQNQEPQLIAGFAELNDPDVIGFKIHYKDDQTTAEHTELAKQHGIAYQHTKVVLKDGKVVKKSPEAWTKDNFLEEMRKL